MQLPPPTPPNPEQTSGVEAHSFAARGSAGPLAARLVACSLAISGVVEYMTRYATWYCFALQLSPFTLHHSICAFVQLMLITKKKGGKNMITTQRHIIVSRWNSLPNIQWILRASGSLWPSPFPWSHCAPPWPERTVPALNGSDAWGAWSPTRCLPIRMATYLRPKGRGRKLVKGNVDT